MADEKATAAPAPYVHKEPEPLAPGIYICRSHGRLLEVVPQVPTHGAICGACSKPLEFVTDTDEIGRLRPVARRGEHLKPRKETGD